MEDDAILDADFLTLLQEIERADASTTGGIERDADESTALFDLLPVDASVAATSNGRSAGSSSSHVERCRLNRKRKKQELDELRASAETLQLTLRQLTQRHCHDDQDDDATSATTWRAASKREIFECQSALKENKKLREMLQQHASAAQSIHRAIQSLPTHSFPAGLVRDSGSAVVPRGLKRPRGPSLSSSTRSRDLYDELFQNIHSAYTENVAGQDASWLKIGTRKISMEMVTHAPSGDNEMCIQVIECQRLPFSLSYVDDATWKHLSVPSLGDAKGSDQCGRAVLSTHGDDLFGDCGTDCHPLPASDELPPGRLAIRRYVEANRLTFVWECDGCFQCDGTKKPIGRVTERGWCTIEPNDTDSETPTVFRIQVQYVSKQSDATTTPSSGGGGCCPRVNLSNDAALHLYRGTISRIFGAVEREVFKDKEQVMLSR